MLQEQRPLGHVCSDNYLAISQLEDSIMGRGILLWLLGVPIPIIILLALFAR